VEVRFSGDEAQVRDSKYQGPQQDQPIITMPVSAWPAFLAYAVDQAAPKSTAIPVIKHHSSGTTLHTPAGTVLDYTPFEWDCFTAGIQAGEFTLPEAALAVSERHGVHMTANLWSALGDNDPPTRPSYPAHQIRLAERRACRCAPLS
jgi:hypothetical protein